MTLFHRSFRNTIPAYRHFSRVMATAAVCLFFAYGSIRLPAQVTGSIPEEIEWTWEVRPPHPDPHLPNVLLLGDSITRNYYPAVKKNLDGVANVYLMASSTSVGDPRLPSQIAEFVAMEAVSFRVVHFNNGMHGWNYSEAEYLSAFPTFLRAIHAIPGNASLIWASITPVMQEATNGATNPRIDARNAAAMTLVGTERIPVDDQHALMVHHLDLYEDTVHFNETGAKIMGDQASAIIRKMLQVPQ
jgi:lysophospholipase L1-like esterase